MNADKQPSPATRAALVALLRADPAITATHRARILAAFDGNAPAPSGWIPASVAAVKCGVSLATVTRWAEAGKVPSRRQGERLTLVDGESVADLAASLNRPTSAESRP